MKETYSVIKSRFISTEWKKASLYASTYRIIYVRHFLRIFRNPRLHKSSWKMMNLRRFYVKCKRFEFFTDAVHVIARLE